MTSSPWQPRNWPRWLRAVLAEPLMHFLAAGLALFLWFGWAGGAVDPASRTIVIDEPKVAQMAAQWTQVWQRAPTASELDGLIRDYVREEIYYREAMRLGLDADDVVIRRRLRNKMEYLARAELDNVEPTDAILQKWLDARRGDYVRDARISFDQVYLPVERRGDAAALLAKLNGGADWRTLGARIALPPRVERAGQSDIARDFGDGFARAVAAMPPGGWQGPVESGFGLHLVRVREHAPGTMPPLAEVRQTVANDWRAATERTREDAAYQALLDAYTIRIARP